MGTLWVSRPWALRGRQQSNEKCFVLQSASHGLAASCLCDLRQVTLPLPASAFVSVKWGGDEIQASEEYRTDLTTQSMPR